MSAQPFRVRETPARGETSARGGRNAPGQVERRPDAEDQSVTLITSCLQGLGMADRHPGQYDRRDSALARLIHRGLDFGLADVA
jgi:hypothetical protein